MLQGRSFRYDWRFWKSFYEENTWSCGFQDFVFQKFLSEDFTGEDSEELGDVDEHLEAVTDGVDEDDEDEDAGDKELSLLPGKRGKFQKFSTLKTTIFNLS